MNWLTPLGFLGLIGLAVLILIYLLKPNYQQKAVSSTFVWKLSLKYRRRRNPISKLRNLLILLCQILIITACAFVLAQPAFANETAALAEEKIFVIDASASMRASMNGETRFERAVHRAAEDASDALKSGGNVTVILAGKKAEYLFFRVKRGDSEAENITTVLYDLIVDPNDFGCTYGSGDIAGAMALAETITEENAFAEVYFYTGTTYLDKGSVNVIDVSVGGEFNVAVLSGRAELVEGYYEFYVDVASYGEGNRVNITCDVKGANPTGTNPAGESVRFTVVENLPKDQVITLEVDPASGSSYMTRIYAFESVSFTIDIRDSFLEDNSYMIYGGAREQVKVLYYNPDGGNPFVSTVLLNIANENRSRMDINVTEVFKGDPVTEGYDLYIYENFAPALLPEDGMTFLMNPDSEPANVDFTLDATVDTSKDNLFYLTAGDSHEITKYFNVDDIGVSRYTRVADFDRGSFSALMYCNGDPVFLVSKQKTTSSGSPAFSPSGAPLPKLMIMSFSLNYSTMPVQYQFPVMMYSIFEYCLPATTQGYVFDVNEEITLASRGGALKVSGPDGTELNITSFPATLSLDVGGTYSLRQILVNQDLLNENIFVRIPNTESDISKEIVALNGPVIAKNITIEYDYLPIFIILGVMVALLFAEWFLHSHGA